MFQRYLSYTPRRLKGQLFPKFTSKEELSEFLRKPTWQVHDVIPDPSEDSNIDARVVTKMLKLSGLDTNITEKEQKQWIQALNTQVAFINHLSEGNNPTEPAANGSEIFRLLASDHHPPQPWTLEKLTKEVENIVSHVDESKGESGFDTSAYSTVVKETKE